MNATNFITRFDIVNPNTNKIYVSEEPKATMKVSTFDNFTANFKELPPPIPSEYWATLFGFVLITGVGVWLIPSIVRWTRTRADIKKSNQYHQRIKAL